MTHTPGDGNRIIAEFFAVKIEEDTNCMYYLLPNMTTVTKAGWYQVDRMQFHTSFDWLMKVVEKIGKIDFDSVKGMREYCKDNFSESRVNIFSPIETVYNAVIEFINWYNTNRFQTNEP